MNFLDNHDENSWGRIMISHFGNNVYPIMTMIFTLPGIPMIYSGQEARLDKQLEFFEKDIISWGDIPDNKFYQKLITLKKSNPVFWNNNHSLSFMDSLPEGIIGFYRQYKEKQFGTIINLTSEGSLLKISDSSDILFKDENSRSDSIAPSGYLVYKIK